MCSGTRKAYWNGLESNRPRSVLGLVQEFPDKTASTMKYRAFLTYLVHSVLLNFSVEVRCNITFNEHTPVGFPPVEYKEN